MSQQKEKITFLSMWLCVFLVTIHIGCTSKNRDLKCEPPERMILIDFEDQNIGEPVFNQYQEKGVLFPSRPIIIKSKIQTQSGSQVLISRSLKRNDDPGIIPIIFTAPQRKIRLVVGVAKGTPPGAIVTLRAYDQQKGGKVVAQSEVNILKPGPTAVNTPMKVETKSAVIYRVEIQCSKQNFEIIDNLQFCTPGPSLKEDTESPEVKITIPEEKPMADPFQMQVPLRFKITEDQFLKKVTVTIRGAETQTMFTLCGGDMPACCSTRLDEGISLNIPVFKGTNTVIVAAEDFAGNRSVDEWVLRPWPPPLGTYDLLILTPEIFESTLQALVDHKNSTGMPTMIITLESIEQDTNINGRDIQEKIKLAIANAQNLYGIKYVMLVGDVDQFPVRYTRIWDSVSWGHGFSPSDLYYSDLYDENGNFDDWDSDNDNLFGEMNFGNPQNWQDLNQDNVTLIPDVLVGRIPASTVSEVQTMVTKIITHESTLIPSLPLPLTPKRIMLVTGDYPNTVPSAEYIATIMINFAYEIIRHYHTDDWVTTCPNTNPQWVSCRVNLLNTDMNEGMNFVVNLGHGDGGIVGNANGNGGLWGGWYHYSNIPSLNNSNKRMPVILSSGCNTAMFHFPHEPYETKSGGEYRSQPNLPYNQRDAPEPAALQPSSYDLDTMAEHFLVKHDVGGIAYIGGYTGLQPWAINLIKYFFEEFVSLGGNATLGDLWSGAIKRYINIEFPNIQNMLNGWGPTVFHHIQKMMLFGDPSLRFPESFDICSYIPELCEVLLSKNDLYKLRYIFKSSPLRFIYPDDHFIIPVEKINEVFFYGQPIKTLPNQLNIHINSPTQILNAAIYDETGTLTVEDKSDKKNKILRLKTAKGSKYWLVLSPGSKAKLDKLFEINLRTEH